MAQNDIDDVLDQQRRIKSGGDLHVDKIDEIERLQMHIGIFRTFSKYNHVLLPKYVVKITKKAKLIVEMIHSVFGGIPDKCNTNLNLERLESQLLEFTEGNTILRYNYELNDSDLLEYMDCIEKNLNDVWMCLDKNLNDVIQMCLKLGTTDHSSTNEQFLRYNRFLEQVKIIQKKMRILRDLYATEINGYVDYDKLEGLETRFQFMADNVGQFCLALSYKLDEDEDDTDDIESKSPYLLSLVVLVELEMKKIFLDELKGSNFT